MSHLEASNSAMAEDLIHKTALIDHFSVDSKTGRFFDSLKFHSFSEVVLTVELTYEVHSMHLSSSL